MLIRLNHKIVQQKMDEHLLRPIDLAGKLGVASQMANFILHKGGLQYAPELAKIFDCRVAELLITWPKKPNNKKRKGD